MFEAELFVAAFVLEGEVKDEVAKGEPAAFLPRFEVVDGIVDLGTDVEAGACVGGLGVDDV